MTNKRKHQLERKVRVNFINFNQIIYPEYIGIKFLDQITKLSFNSTWYLYYRGNMTHSETYFMLSCISRYYWYYKKLINKNLSQNN